MIPLEIVEAVLGAPTDTLPSVIGVNLGDRGYAVVKLIKVVPRDESPNSVSRSRATYERVWADAEARAYYAALQKRFKAKISVKSPRVDARPPI
jgi:peptidyl-prolyl cis-trans isomerase D